ncbi:MAG: extracellular solute-binding protein, partial [Sphingomicrobium sp.]
MELRRRIAALASGALVCAALAAPAAAQPFTPDTVDMAAAKKEGSVTWYTSTPVETAQKIANLFTKETGIKVELFRSGGTAVLRRFLQEREGGRVAADVLSTADPAASASLARKGMFAAFKPRNFAKIADTAKDPDGYHVAYRLNMVTFFVRTDKVAASDVPKTWSDLVDPKYRGKMILTDPSFTSLQVTVVGTLARLKGWSYYDGLRRNDIMVVQGNQQVADMLKRGERLIAAGALDTYAVDARREGHPIANIFPADGTFAVPGPSGIAAGAPNPNAAKLFAEFLISDTAQKSIVADGAYSPRTDLPPPAGSPPLKEIKLLPVDYDQIEKDASSVKKKFNEVFQ